jgi:RNA polymerase sigma factor (sigma-70 family)
MKRAPNEPQMPTSQSPDTAAAEDMKIAATLERERPRLWSFIRRRVRDRFDAEDILQNVFYEVVVAHRLAKPIEQAGVWMFRVARNRIIDLIRRKTAVSLDRELDSDDGVSIGLANILRSGEAGPEAAYAQRLLIAELEDALAELPENQRAVFLAHEFEGRSFREIAAETGVGVNTLLWRKHQAAVRLRRRLQTIYNDLGSM